MAAVEDAAADGLLDAVSTDDDDAATHLTSPHVGYDKHGHFDHCYWRREHCGIETTDKRALDACC
ncbi:hypothetical protein DMJ13_20730 [halophilic archaeon]|nr:hypothetical protein DMJ13_20730 [halophilic archaeon]